MGKAFSSLPDDQRMKIRNVLENQHRCYCSGYYGESAAFAVPRGDLTEIRQAIAELGLSIVSDTYFPLCSDKPSEHLRHDGPRSPYPGYLGNWRYLHVKPVEASE